MEEGLGPPTDWGSQATPPWGSDPSSAVSVGSGVPVGPCLSHSRLQWGPSVTPDDCKAKQERCCLGCDPTCFCSDLTEVFPGAIVQLIRDALMGIK